MKVNIINEKTNATLLNFQMPTRIEKYKKEFERMKFNEDDIKYRKVKIENAETGIDYLDKVLNEMQYANLNDLNDLSICIEDYLENQKEEYNAILKYEHDNENIKNVNDLIQIAFETNCYLYEKDVKNLDELTNKIIERSPDAKKLSFNDAKSIIEYFYESGEGKFEKDDNGDYYIGYLNQEKIENRKIISEYKMRDWEGNFYKFKADIITALGITEVAKGTLYKDEKMILNTNVNYHEYVDQLEKILGREHQTIFEDEAKSCGVMNVYFGDERIMNLKILDIQEENLNSKEQESESNNEDESEEEFE